MTTRSNSRTFAKTLSTLMLATVVGSGCGTAEEAEQAQQPEIGQTSSAITLGGIDLTAQCRRQTSDPAAHVELTKGASAPGAAYAWICQAYYGQFALDLNAACRTQYGLSTAYARANDPNNAYSWQCIQPRVCYRDNDGCSAGDPVYRSVFNSACVGHDRCYSTPGASKASCDSSFASAMANICRGRADVLICLGATAAFYAAVAESPQAQSAYNNDQAAVAGCTSVYDHGELFWQL